MKLELNGIPLELTPRGKGWLLTMDGQSAEVEVLRAEAGLLELSIDGRRVTACVTADGDRRWVTVDGATFVLARAGEARRRRGAHPASAGLTAPMPGQVRAVNVKEGDTVKAGQTLVLVEAMKMEIRVQSPRDGVVRRVLVQPGQAVEREQLLIEVDEDGKESA